jgi:ribosomal-protein-alanine N-acetyltransferase
MLPGCDERCCRGVFPPVRDDCRNFSDLTIEPVQPSDLSEVLLIERGSFVAPWSRAAFEAELEKPYANLYLARSRSGEKAGGVIGYICFWLVADEIQVVNVAVHMAWRRRGIGNRLMRYALERGCEAGANVAVLEVRRSNEAARALYEGLGFHAVSERPGYYPEFKEPAVILEMDLDKRWSGG